MSVETDERVDLSDLDLLDDEQRHARCTYCQPVVPAMSTYIGLCGARAVALGWRDDEAEPPNACRECSALWYQPCRRCGA